MLQSFIIFIFVIAFIGEDLNNKARTKFQQEQLREWSTQQANEKEQAKRNQDYADRLYNLKMKELDQRAVELQNAEEECRRAINVATTDYNNALVCIVVNFNGFRSDSFDLVLSEKQGPGGSMS